MKELSLTNGMSFVSINELEKVKKNIVKYWDSIIIMMDKDDMEEVNNFTQADTDTNEGKIEYIKDYLSIAKDNLIIG